MDFVTDLALAFIAFGVGKYFKLSALKANGKNMVILTLFEALIAGIFITTAMLLMGLSLSFSLLLGAIDVYKRQDYAISMEGSLKLKEISYIHSEAYAAGELKHGTISLIEEGTLVVALATQEALYPKTVSNVVEVKTRGAFVMALTNEDNTEIEKVSDFTVYIPKINRYFSGSLAIIPLQLFAYYVSLGRGLDVDKPRNLAKSVTVE